MSDVEREIERLVSGHALIDTPSAMRALARWCYADAAKVVDALEIRDPSRLSRREQLRIYDVLNQAQAAIEQRAREISE